MRLKVDSDNEVYTMLTLNDSILPDEELKRIAKVGHLSGNIKDMKMRLIVSCQYADKIYALLSSGLCRFGLEHTDIYYIKRPIMVNDVDDKKHYEFVADVDFVENDMISIDTKA